MTSPILRDLPDPTPRNKGFTLLELLVSVATGLVIMGVAGPIIVSGIRGGLINERFQRSQQDFLRLSSLIDAEVSEGSRLQFAQATAGCSPSGSSVVTITIPYEFDTSTLLPREAVVHYFIDSGALYRCGPPINANGSLDPDGSIATSQINSNTLMTVNSASNTKGLDYTLSIRDENNQVIFSGTGGSRTRAGIIDN